MRFKLTTAAAIVFVLGTQCANGQDIVAIQTDRPDQTECPFIVPSKHFQIETGCNFEHINSEEQQFILPSVLWKYGVNDKFELRLITEYIAAEVNDETINGITPVQVGFKTSLIEGKGIVPLTSFIAHISLPDAASSEFKNSFYATDFRFTMQHELSDRISLGYNLGAEWDGESPEPTFIYTVAAGIGVTDRIGIYAELFGFAPQEHKSIHQADAGITFLIKQNIMVDISSGIGLSKNAPEMYGSLGFSIRLPD